MTLYVMIAVCYIRAPTQTNNHTDDSFTMSRDIFLFEVTYTKPRDFLKSPRLYPNGSVSRENCSVRVDQV